MWKITRAEILGYFLLLIITLVSYLSVQFLFTHSFDEMNYGLAPALVSVSVFYFWEKKFRNIRAVILMGIFFSLAFFLWNYYMDKL